MNPIALRSFLAALILSSGGAAFSQSSSPIDRRALVQRHTVIIADVNAWTPLSVGNGEFAFTVDASGLQSFPAFHWKKGIPLETLSNWGWHSFPNRANLRLDEANQIYQVQGRPIAYASRQSSPAGDYFRKNPHRIPLGQLGLEILKSDGTVAGPNDLREIHQSLDLWTGLIHSRYRVEGQPVEVQTCCHPDLDLVAVQIVSPLLQQGRIKTRLRFAYRHDPRIKNKPPLDWASPHAHATTLHRLSARAFLLERQLDESHYVVRLAAQEDCDLTEQAAHDFLLRPLQGDTLQFVCAFAPESPYAALPGFDQTRAASARGWADYWQDGGVIDLAGSRDPRAAELERRIVLSQYLVRVNCAGSFPPQESGLTHISWYGKHHTEMVWWHTAHFALWGRSHYLERHLAWYQKILPQARALARDQGFAGARWPKMTGPQGRPSPGTINPFIIWNQPHPIYLAELCYRAHPEPETLERFRDIVFASAEYLASYAYYNEQEDRYTLGPPIRSVSENREENLTRNPTFELAYWHYGLTLAQTWRERLGLRRDATWDRVLSKLSPLPSKEGLYLDIETDPNLFLRNRVSSSMLMALGFLPKTPPVDASVMNRTLDKVIEKNGMDSFVSWSLGRTALTAARLGRPELAVDILSGKQAGARFLANGHVPRPKEPLDCPAYLPVNGSLLAAVVTMAAGWEGSPDVPAPGFPQDGSWTVRWEGLKKSP